MPELAQERQNITDIVQSPQYNIAVADSQNWKVMLHVSTGDPVRLNIVLNEAEALLKEYTASTQKLELEILTNNNGLNLVTDNGESYSKRLKSLQGQYDNLILTACGETLKRISSTYKKLPLLTNTRIVSSALKQIVKRKKEGWIYIRI